ncbi:MAG: restriction endonuclease [Eubacteriales bacterium]|nr:restriction endonuclease [Eubacteriales bacterium]
MIWLLELLAALAMYCGGYWYYCNGNIEYTACFAMACAIFCILFLRSVWSGRYVNMPMKRIDRLSGAAFEQYLIVQFRRLGYRVKTTEISHDYGADLIMKKRGEKIVVQAKRYERNIGISAVQEAVAAIAYYEADRAMVVTNRYFTKSARNLARQNDVELWGRDEIRKKFRIRGE